MAACGGGTPVPQRVPMQSLAEGQVRILQWDGQTIAVVHTDAGMLEDLQAQTVHTWSGSPPPSGPTGFVVLSLVNSATGCTLQHAPKSTPRYAPGREWQGGFYDPCRFGEWDYAGRAIKQYADQQESMRQPDLEMPRFSVDGTGMLSPLE